MEYSLDFTNQALRDINFHNKSGNKSTIKKLLTLFSELRKHPLSGIGKPEPLKHQLSGYWSRRVNREHRIIYEVLEDSILVLSVKGHY